MKVIATAKGYFNGVVRQPGQEFEVPEGIKGSWFKPVDADDKSTTDKKGVFSRDKSKGKDTGDDVI